MKIIINTISAKRKAGGAFQVSINFLRGTLNYLSEDVDWYYITSSDIDAAVGDLFADIKDMKYFVFPTQPDFLGSYRKVKKQLKALENKISADVIYSVTAPCYFQFKTPEVMRFTNPWVANSNKYAWRTLSFLPRIKMHLYCMYQQRLMKKCDYFITQTESVKSGVMRVTSLPSDHICVVPNVLPSVFDNIQVNKIEGIYSSSDWIDIACVAAGHPQKNIPIIVDVLLNLRKKYNINNVRFNITLKNDSEIWQSIKNKCEKLGLSKQIINHGYLPQEKLADLYKKSTICFLPTLLETFSASPLEGMYFGLYIIATDLPFNRDVIGDAGLYYEPTNAESAADKIANILNNNALRTDLTEKMTKQIKKYVSFKDYFNHTVKFLKEVAQKKKN